MDTASPREMAELTQQFKNNSEDLTAYMRDLRQWHTQMEAKDQQLLRAKADNDPESAWGVVDFASGPSSTSEKEKRKSEDKQTEAVETSDQPKKVKKEDNDGGSPKKNGSRIKSYEYDKWDKFDVDEALKDIDTTESEAKSPEKKQKPPSSNSAEERLSEIEMKSRAEVEKEKGNGFYKAGKWDEAISCYTTGIALDPKNPILPANRAMTLIKKGYVAAAEKDCTTALELDPTYVKARLRRATCRSKLGDFDGAAKDCLEVMKAEPSNKAAAAEYQKLLTLMKESQEGGQSQTRPSTDGKKGKVVVSQDSKNSFKANMKQAFQSQRKTEPSDDQSTIEIFPVHKNPSERSTMPLRTVKVVDVCDIDLRDDKSEGRMGEDELKPVQTVMKKMKEIKVSEQKENLGETEVNGKQPPQPSKDVEETKQSILNRLAEIDGKNNSKSDLDSKKNPTPKAKNAGSKQSKPPKNSIEFFKKWNQLGRLEDKADYMRVFRAEDYAKVFKHSLEPDFFSKLLEALDRLADNEMMSKHLKGLSMIPRISAVVMFLSSDDIKLLKKLLERAKKAEPEFDAAKVAAIFRC